MFDPDAGMPRENRTLIYLGAGVIAGLRPAREKQVNLRVVPTGQAIIDMMTKCLAIPPAVSHSPAFTEGKEPRTVTRSR